MTKMRCSQIKYFLKISKIKEQEQEVMGLESIQVGGGEACGQEECAPHSSEERVTLGQIGAGIGGQMAGRGGGAPSIWT